MMIRLPVLLLALALPACAACPACPPCPACPACPAAAAAAARDPGRWFVIKVKDGDTLVARLEGGPTERVETIRLLNVNTPERNERLWAAAGEALKSLVRGGWIDLEFERPGVERRDGFGRLLAYVLADGANVNLALVRQGWSAFYTKYGRGRLAAEFAAAEAEARARGAGLWAEGRR
jgi:micrococcal nuclease